MDYTEDKINSLVFEMTSNTIAELNNIVDEYKTLGNCFIFSDSNAKTLEHAASLLANLFHNSEYASHYTVEKA